MTTAETAGVPPGEWLAGRPEQLAVTAGGATVSGLVRPGTRLARVLAFEGAAAAMSGALAGFARAAADRGCLTVRAEVADDHPAATALAAAGFRPLDPGVHAGQPARPVRRFERRLDGGNAVRTQPYFAQTTGFTCGPVALMLARRRFAASAPVDRRTEVALWREATTVHAPAGPGGCDPFGLACAAVRGGLATRVIASAEGPILLDRASDEARRDLMRFVQAEFRADATALGIDVEIREWTDGDLAATLAAGGVAMVLIDQVVFHGRPAPHWVLVHGMMTQADSAVTYAIDDPWVDAADHETDTDRFDLPVPAAELDRMAWYGTTPYRAAVLLEAGALA